MCIIHEVQCNFFTIHESHWSIICVSHWSMICVSHCCFVSSSGVHPLHMTMSSSSSLNVSFPVAEEANARAALSATRWTLVSGIWKLGGALRNAGVCV